MTTSTDQPNQTDTLPADFDAKAMNERYREEREKTTAARRKRAVHRGEGPFSHYLDDPYPEHRSSANRLRMKSTSW